MSSITQAARPAAEPSPVAPLAGFVPRRSLAGSSEGAVYVELLVAFVPVLLFFSMVLQVALLYAARVSVEHAATVAARTAALAYTEVPEGRTFGDAHHGLVRQAALLSLAPLILDGSLDDLSVVYPSGANGPAAGGAYPSLPQPRPGEPFDPVPLVWTRIVAKVRCKLPLGGRLVCALAGGAGGSAALTVSAVSAYPAQPVRFIPPKGCESGIEPN